MPTDQATTMKTITYNPETHKLVPLVPTEEMYNRVRSNGGPQAVGFALASWNDMLAAAPAAEEALGQEPVESLQRKFKLLAEALGSCIKASGIVRKDIDGFSGPQLLMFAEDLKEMLLANQEQQPATHGEPVAMANYTLAIEADSGYESTMEGRCNAEQYGLAVAALHGNTAPQPTPELVQAARQALEALNAVSNIVRSKADDWQVLMLKAKTRESGDCYKYAAQAGYEIEQTVRKLNEDAITALQNALKGTK